MKNLGLETDQVWFVADPLCAWGWEASPSIRLLAATCHQHGIGFRMLMCVASDSAGTGQASRDRLAEPACRAVIAVRELVRTRRLPRPVELAFFMEVQKRIFVQGDDPGESCFYTDICRKLGIPYEAFRQIFSGHEGRALMSEEARICRDMGLVKQPTVFWQRGAERVVLATKQAAPERLLAVFNARLATYRCPGVSRKLDI